MITSLALVCFARAAAQPAWVPAHFSIPTDTISPDGRYGVMMPDAETDGSNDLVDMKTGRLVAELAGEPGWRETDHSMRWGEMEAKWSADATTLCWIHPDKWFPESYVVLRLKSGRLAWQVELMKLADREILARTEAASPVNFAIAKLDHAEDGSAYPEGFSIDVSEPEETFSLPLVCTVALTSNPKESDDEPEENGVRAWLTMRVGTDGSVTYSHFKVKNGPLAPDAKERIKAHTANISLLDTDVGKAMLFPGLISRDGQFAVGWTIQAAKGEPPVDWSHWDPTDPDKLLRLYDWQRYGYTGKVNLPYEAVDFILDTRNGKTAQLPTKNPNWPGKRDNGEMIAHWYSGMGGQRYVLAESGFWDGNFWLVNLGDSQMQVKDLITTMRMAVNDLLRERRPEVAAADFDVSYQLKAGDEALNNDLVEVPFVANAPSWDQREFQLSGTVTIRLSDGKVPNASSSDKRLEPFVTNEALRNADETLNSIFQSVLKSLPPKDAQAFRLEERDWIVQRDADASQAVNITPFGSTQEAYEEARENSLLESTNKRIKELKHRVR